MKFGTDENLRCIVDVDVTSPRGEPLCLGYKSSTTFVGLGVSVSDDGYILKVRGKNEYFPLDGPAIEQMQAEGSLPTPLPGYSLSTFDYLFGYSLWLVLVGVAFVTVVGHRRAARRRAADAAAPLDAPPQLLTEADRFIAAQFEQVRRDGEQIQRQAYVLARPPTGGVASAVSQKAYFAVLTDQRLMRFETRVGAFSILLENRACLAHELREITSAALDDDTVSILLSGGGGFTMHVPSSKKLSNQDAFRRDVARLLLADRARRDGAALVG